VLKIGRAFNDDACALLDAEWIDLIGFVRSEDTPSDGPKRMRELYQGALGCAGVLRREGMNVLAGVWPEPKPVIPDFAYAVLAVSPRVLTGRHKTPAHPARPARIGADADRLGSRLSLPGDASGFGLRARLDDEDRLNAHAAIGDYWGP
jgi:hypothetical protein